MASSRFSEKDYARLLQLIGPAPVRFALEEGKRRWLELQRLDPSSPFLRPPPGAPSGTVALEACRVLAGRKYGVYPSRVVGESIATWVIPLFILLGNINLSGFSQLRGLNELSTIAHILGNPVDALWGLATKLDVARHIREVCREENEFPSEDKWVYAMILIVLDDFDFSEHFETRLGDLRNVAREGDEEAIQACRQAAIDLSINRVKNTRRSILAAIGYCTAVFAKFWLISPQTIAPQLPHTIAFRVLYYFLGPVMIMSVIIGGYQSEWTSVGILKNLQERVPSLNFNLKPLTPWTGGNYAWRPKKDVAQVILGRRDYRSGMLALLSVMSVTAAWLPSFCLSFITPTPGLGPRSLIQLISWLWWVLWGGLSWGSWYFGERDKPNYKKRWIVMSCLNSISAVTHLLVILSSLRGYWNSCWGWSATLGRGETHAYFNFEMIAEIQNSLYSKYLPIVIVSMVLQLALTLAMLRLSQGMARTDIDMNEEAQRLYCQRLNQPYSPPGARKSKWQRFRSSCSSSILRRLRARRGRDPNLNDEFLLETSHPQEREGESEGSV